MIIQLKPTYEATILAVNTVRSFLESGHYGESYWRDENGEGFTSDIGYLFEGLDEIKNIAKKGRINDSIHSRSDIRRGGWVYDIGDCYRREG